MKAESIEIGRLLLEDVEVADPAAMARSIETELRRLTRSGEWPEQVSTGSLEWQPSEGAEKLSSVVAQRILQAIPRSSR